MTIGYLYDGPKAVLFNLSAAFAIFCLALTFPVWVPIVVVSSWWNARK
jgi:hypothetical protein